MDQIGTQNGAVEEVESINTASHKKAMYNDIMALRQKYKSNRKSKIEMEIGRKKKKKGKSQSKHANTKSEYQSNQGHKN